MALAAMAAAPAAADTLVVANKAEATATLIDLTAGEAVATLATGVGPHEVAVSPDGRTAVIADYGTVQRPGRTLTVLDIPGAAVTATIELGAFSRPHGMAWLPDGRHLLVTAEAAHALIKVDVGAGRIVASYPTAQDVSHMVAVAPDGGRAYVANIGSGSVTVIDLVAGRRLANVPTGAGAEGIDITPDGAEVWVTNRDADTVTVLDAATLEVVATVPAPSFPIRAKVTPDGEHVLVSCAEAGVLAVYDRAARKLAREVRFDLEATATAGRLFGDQFGKSPVPVGVVVAPDGSRAFVAHTQADRVALVDLASWRPAGALTAGKEPDGMAYSRLTPRKAAPGD
jgi:YVTN family beta-propeller protein